MKLLGTVAAALVAILPTALFAAPSASQLAAVEEAGLRGAEMFAYDQAAWHATDRFQADIRKRGDRLDTLLAQGLQGYIVEPAEGGALQVTFFGEQTDRRFAIARYIVSGRSVIGGGFIERDANPDLSLLALRMIAAREAAIGAAQKPGHEFCSNSQPNTLVLPPRSDGTLPVYILTSTTEAGSYPAGGHYRFDFDADGTLVGERRFTKSCFPLAYRGDRDKKPEMMFLTHLLDPQPTEIHAFVSRNIPVPLMIATTMNRMLWGITNGRIEYVDDIPDKK